MNAPDMIDFALGQLEGDDASQASLEVQSDPALAERIDRLGLGIRRMLDDDPNDTNPPKGLAERTIAFVETSIRERASIIEFVPRRPRVRREDFAVAATIFLASLLALAPAILRGRERWGRAACTNNLHKVGMRLNQYAAMNQSYPFVSTDDDLPHVGAFVCKLSEAGLPLEPMDLACPCSGSDCGKAASLPHRSAICDAMKRSHDEGSKMLKNDFAFHVGYRRGLNGDPGPVPAHPQHATPILADQPTYSPDGDILPGNSPNHAGRGQNVLFADGHVAWHDNRWVSPDDNDLYLNNENRPAYGTGPADSVLMPSVFKVKTR